ncbi:MAG: GNAT family N-acetyltransferase [Motilibacteraceae bacterium]
MSTATDHVLASDRPLADVLQAAALGDWPEPDGRVEVVPRASGGAVAAVLAFPAHFVVAADVDAGWVADLLPAGDFCAPTGPRFLTALAERVGGVVGCEDAVLTGLGTGEGPRLTRPGRADGHPRLERAKVYREDLQVLTTPDDDALLVVARGLAGRWEAAFEVEPQHRRRGLGRALVAEALRVVPAGEPLFVQVSPGNAGSLRAILAAGLKPIGAEVLLAPAAPTP